MRMRISVNGLAGRQAASPRRYGICRKRNTGKPIPKGTRSYLCFDQNTALHLNSAKAAWESVSTHCRRSLGETTV